MWDGDYRLGLAGHDRDGMSVCGMKKIWEDLAEAGALDFGMWLWVEILWENERMIEWRIMTMEMIFPS
jgi:hypothetical protein